MLKINRLNFIMDYLNKNKSATRKELAESLNVTLMTVGRDLKELEEDGKIICLHGGATLKTSLNEETLYENKKKNNLEIKKQIAKEAIKYIKSGMTLILDAGTTVFELASLLATSNFENLIVITNDLFIALELNKNKKICVNFLGGEILQETGSSNSLLTFKHLSLYNADIAFLGASSITTEFIVTSPNETKSIIKNEMIERALKSFLLVDSSKFYKEKLYKVAPLNNFDYIITDFEEDNGNLEWKKLKNKLIKIK